MGVNYASSPQREGNSSQESDLLANNYTDMQAHQNTCCIWLRTGLFIYPRPPPCVMLPKPAWDRQL